MKKYYVTVNGKRYAVEVEEVLGDFEESDEMSLEAGEIINPINKSSKDNVLNEDVSKSQENISAAPEKLGEKVECPMPGTILRVNVNAGDRVKEGQVLLILEAMKMENEIMASRDCTILKVNAVKGAMVNTGDTLLEIE